MSVPVLKLAHAPEVEACPDCGAECGVGFVDGHRQFCHGVPNRSQAEICGDSDGGWVVKVPAGIGVVVGLVVDVLVAGALTDGGRSLFFITAHGDVATSVLVVVTAVLLLPLAIATSLVVVVVLMLPMAGVNWLWLLLTRRSEVPFHKRGTFTCVVKKKPISARYELIATREGIKWRFWPASKDGAELHFMVVGNFAHEAGPAIEAALALPDDLKTYRSRQTAEAEIA